MTRFFVSVFSRFIILPRHGPPVDAADRLQLIYKARIRRMCNVERRLCSIS